MPRSLDPESPQPTEAALSTRAVWNRFLLYPTHTLPTAAAPVLVAAGLAARDNCLAPLPLFLVFVGSWAIHVAGVLGDNHELLRRHGDIAEHPELQRALSAGSLTLRALRRAILACLLLAVVCGIHPIAIGGMPALVIGAIGVVASLGYACGPRPYARTGLADPIFLLMFGTVAVAGSYYVQAAASRASFGWADMPWEAFVLGLPVGCVVTAVLVIDDIRDRSFDSRKGWNTTAVRFGLRGSRAEWCALLFGAYALPVWFWVGLGLGSAVLLPWLTLPFAWSIGRAVCRHDTEQALLRMTPRTSMLSLIHATLLALGIAVA
ncbi:MAG: UbiA family prenyltransferase [Planctomycetes bacterium]|nr:UbiA family prenyltransferase [Planctomycetota bacterium]